jgi:hypothetical protein
MIAGSGLDNRIFLSHNDDAARPSISRTEFLGFDAAVAVAGIAASSAGSMQSPAAPAATTSAVAPDSTVLQNMATRKHFNRNASGPRSESRSRGRPGLHLARTYAPHERRRQGLLSRAKYADFVMLAREPYASTRTRSSPSRSPAPSSAGEW